MKTRLAFQVSANCQQSQSPQAFGLFTAWDNSSLGNGAALFVGSACDALWKCQRGSSEPPGGRIGLPGNESIFPYIRMPWVVR